MDTHLRSLTKGMSWRVIATLVTTLVVWSLSGEVSMALFAGLSDSLIKIGLFWGHERVWQGVTWGRQDIQEVHDRHRLLNRKSASGHTWAGSLS